MIPYVILQAHPNGPYTNFSNTNIEYYDCKDKDELKILIINHIIVFMYEFCSKKYGHGIDIESYDDFCNKWWEKQENKIDDVDIFEINYYENSEWKTLKINEIKDEIFNEYEKYVKNIN